MKRRNIAIRYLFVYISTGKHQKDTASSPAPTHTELVQGATPGLGLRPGGPVAWVTSPFTSCLYLTHVLYHLFKKEK